MMNPVQNSFSFLIESVFELYMVLVLLRFLLQLFKVNFGNPLIEPIIKLTQSPLAWLRRFVPGLFGVDLSALVLLVILGIIKLTLLAALDGYFLGPAGLLIKAIAQILSMTLWVFTIALIAQAVLSWFASSAYHPIMGLLQDLTAPLLRPIKRILPMTGGLDFSPIIALIGLSFIRRLIIDPLHYFAGALM